MSQLHECDIVKNFSHTLVFGLQENGTLPLPKVEGDDRTQARALATLYSHPVVSVHLLAFSTPLLNFNLG